MRPTDPERPEHAALRAFAEQALPGPLAFEDRTRTFGRPTLLWEIVGRAGARRFLERHESRIHFDRERAAFFEGYGETLSPHAERRLEMLTYLVAIPTVAWATAHGDVAFEAYGRRLLDELAPRVG